MEPHVDKAEVLSRLDFRAYYSAELPSIRWNGKEGLALCPFHDDHEPSLSVNPATGLFKCFGCGFQGDVFTFHGKKYDLSFQDAVKELATIAGLKKSHKRKIVSTYDYIDGQGNLVYQVVRFEPKDFRQRRPDGNGGWIWNLNGIETILYNVPEVIKADTVYIVEGEKDVETLRGLGFVATTNPMGAGKWKTHFNQYLAGKDIVILPDNDEQGRKHSEDVAKNLTGVAKSIKVVTLPDVPDKGDVTDFLKIHNKDDFLQLIEQAKEWRGTETRFIKPSHFYLRDETYEPEYLVEDLILAKCIILLAGSPGAMKTFLMQMLLVATAEGVSFLGRRTKQTKFFYFDRENPEDLWHKRLVREFKIRVSDEFVYLWPYWHQEPPPKFLDKTYVDLAKNNPGSVFLFDSYSKFLPKGYSENTNENAADVTNFLREITAHDVTVILIHHGGKDTINGVRGAEEILAGVDVAFTLSKNDNRLTLKSIKNRFMQDSTILIDVKTDIDGYIYFEDASEDERVKKDLQKKSQVKIASAIILELIKAGTLASKKAVIAKLKKGLDIGDYTARQILDYGLRRNFLSYDKVTKQLGVVDVDVLTPKGGSTSSTTAYTPNPLMNHQSTTGKYRHHSTIENHEGNTVVDGVNQQQSTTVNDEYFIIEDDL